MGRVKDFLTKFKFVRHNTAEDLARRAAEHATNEEKNWHVHDRKGSSDSKFIVSDEPQDRFYLYEQDEAPPSKDKSNEERRLEAFYGGHFYPTYASAYGTTQTVSELNSLQNAVYAKYYTDPHCRSIIENWTYYTIGGGVKINIDNVKVNKIINDFRYKNRMASREKDFVRSTYIEGELFIAYYVNPISGEVSLRRIRPQEIVEVETHPQDIETKFSYHWEYEHSPEGTDQSYSKDSWVADIKYNNYLLDKYGANNPKSKKKLAKMPVIQHIKMSPYTEIRGRVPMQPVLRHLKYYEDWLMDRIRLNHERAKVVWIKEITGRMPESTERQRRSPKGGVMLLETENVKYRIEKPQINADDAKEDGLQILYTIGAGTSLPIHILNQRSDQQVYASIRKADTPFSQYIRGKQEFFQEHFETMYREVIERAVEAGRLPKRVRVPEYTQESMIEVLTKINEMVVENKAVNTISEYAQQLLQPAVSYKPVITADIPVNIEFPEVIREDMEAQAKVFQIHKEIGIASAATLAAKAGYNWRQELVNMMNESSMFPDSEDEPKSKEEPTVKPKDNEPPKGGMAQAGDRFMGV